MLPERICALLYCAHVAATKAAKGVQFLKRGNPRIDLHQGHWYCASWAGWVQPMDGV
jgi:hypothetical protein